MVARHVNSEVEDPTEAHKFYQLMRLTHHLEFQIGFLKCELIAN